jgi:hypothetical protein
MEEPRVTTQAGRPSIRSGRVRFAYVLHLPGEWPYVSAHRYGSEEAARKAGETDLAATLAYYAEEKS